MSIVDLTVSVSDISVVLELYDRIQVWRSTSGPSGSYVEITDNSPQPARLVGTVDATWTLVGEVLTIILNGADPVSVTFTGLDPLSLSDVISQINLAITNLASQSAPGSALLALTHPLAGTGSWIQVSGTAATILGLSTSKVNGKSARPVLGNKVDSYPFSDLDGDPAYYYKTKFYSTVTNSLSTFSSPRQGDPSTILPGSVLVKMVVNLLDTTGAPITGRRIILVPSELKMVSNSGTVYGMLPSMDRITLYTDEAGHAEISLAKGTTIRAFFEGSGYSREFIVPDADFDLLTTLSTQPDPFSIVQAPPMPIRES